MKAQLRILGALTAKDLWEGVRNKNAFAIILSALLVVLMYRFLPALTEADEPLRLLLHDAGDSGLAMLLDNRPAFKVYPYATPERVEELLALDGDGRELGVLIPADFDAQLAAGRTPELTVYLMRWLSAAEAQTLVQTLTDEVAAVAGASVSMRVQRVELRPEGVGAGLMPAIGLVYIILMVGMMLPTHLMLEEKQARTLDLVLLSPATPGQFVSAKALVGIVYALLGAGVTFGMNYALVNHWGLAWLTVGVGALFATGLGLLLGVLLETRQQLTLWGWLLFVPLLLPLMLSIMDNLVPASIISVLRWIPTVALFELFRVAFAGAITLGDWAPRWLLVCGYAAALLGFVAWRVRWQER